MIPFLAAQAVATASGGMLLLVLGVRRMPVGLAVTAAWLAGSGVVAAEHLIFLQLGIPWTPWALALPWFAALGGWAVPRRRRMLGAIKRRYDGLPADIWRRAPSRWDVAAGFLILAWTGVMVRQAVLQPLEGGGDAWAMWFLKGRAFFQAGGLPATIFDNHQLAAYAHLDYPLLVPLTIAWTYGWTGDVDTTMKAWWPLLAGACCAGIYWGLERLAPVPVRLTGVVLLLSVPELGEHVVGAFVGYADLPLAVFTLFGALFLYRWIRFPEVGELLLAGLFFGLAGFTKNEGLVTATAGWLLACTLVLRSGRSGVRSALMVTGIEVLLVLPWQVQLRAWGLRPEFSLSLDLLLANWPVRFAAIWEGLSGMAGDTVRFNLIWPVFSLLAGAAFAVSRSRWVATLPLALVSLTQIGAAFAAYLLTPNDLAWHLRFSTDRVVFQWVPLLVLLMTIYLGILIERHSETVAVTNPESEERTPLPG